MGMPLANIYSEHHHISQSQADEHRYRVMLDPKSALPEDFVLRWQLAKTDTPTAAHLTQNINGYHYGLIQLTAPKYSKQSPKRELTFILDTSGSMVGNAIEQAKQALISGIQSLSEMDTFNVIEFNSRAQNLWQSAQSASPARKSQAIEFISQLQASGGTEIADALKLAFSLHQKSEQERLHQMLFITDGSVSNEAELLQLISHKLGDSRLFTVGIGSAPNSYFMTEAAIAGKGTFTFIGDISQVEQKMTALLDKIQRPALTNIQLISNGQALTEAFEIYPNVVPDLYAGEPITMLYRRLNDQSLASPLSIEASWYEKSDPQNPVSMIWQQALPEKKIQANAGISKQWAYQKIRQLTRSLYTSSAQGEDYLALQQQTETTVTETALEHQLVSKYTSLIAIDEQVTRPSEALLAHLAEAASAPTMRNQQWTSAQIQLPQTGTNSWLLIFVGIFLMTGAGLFKRSFLLKAITQNKHDSDGRSDNVY
jgi:Ca-activated chloride channel family protein